MIQTIKLIIGIVYNYIYYALAPVLFILIPIILILGVVWLVLRFAKQSVAIINKILKWSVIIVITMIIIWALLNIIGGLIGV